MPGHVFILRGDIRRFACDAWLIPCDWKGRAESFRADACRKTVRVAGPATGVREPPAASFPAPWVWDERQAWMVNVGFDRRSQQSEADFYGQSVEEALRGVFDSFPRGYKPLHRREVPLVAMPLLGSGRGMPMVEKGATLCSLLDLVYAELHGPVAGWMWPSSPSAHALTRRPSTTGHDSTGQTRQRDVGMI